MQTERHSPAARSTEVTLFLTLLLCYVYFLPRWADWGQNSRLDLVLAIVDRGTLSIDHYYRNTGDFAVFEGRHYSDKAPGPALLAVPVYGLMRPILRSAFVQERIEQLAANPAFIATLRPEGTGLLREKVYHAMVLYAVTAVVVSVPAACLGVLLFRFLGQLPLASGWCAAIVLIYGLATNAFAYAGAFLSHQLTAFLLFAAFYIGRELRRGVCDPRWALGAAVALGWAVISEYPTILIAAAVLPYVLSALPTWRWRAAVALATLPPVCLWMAHNYVIFGHAFEFGYRYSVLYTEEHGVGFLSLTYPHLDALWGVTFGAFRGLFYVSPVLLLAVVGFWPWWATRRLRREWLLCLWAVSAFVLFNASSVMWHGGFGVGPRYLVPMLPFLALGWGGLAARWGQSRALQYLTALLAAYSFVVVWSETIAGQSFPDWSAAPLWQYAVPRLAAGDVARNLGMVLGLRGWSSVLPLAGVLCVMAALLRRQLRDHSR
jgi:hypothetical protein